MSVFDPFLNIIHTENKLEESEVIDAANGIIAIINEKPDLAFELLEKITEIYDSRIEMVKIRAVEIALKILDNCLYTNNKEIADQIIEFLKSRIPSASENIQTGVIIHYSWAHRKFPKSKELVEAYDALMKEFNKNKQFHLLFEDVNHMEGLENITH